MKKFLYFILIFLLLGASVFAENADKISALVYMRERPQGRISKSRQADLSRLARSSQASLIAYLESKKKEGRVESYVSFWIVNGLRVSADAGILAEISQRGDVLSVMTNPKYRLPPPPQTGRDFNLWGWLLPSSARSNIVQISAEAVWDLKDSGGRTITGKGIKVAVLDTGVLSTHVDLSGKIAKEASFDPNGNQTSDTASDQDGHGTHVCGIIAGGNNSGEYIGVAPDAQLLVARIFDDNGNATNASAIAGVEWAVSQEAKVINMSFGGVSGATDPQFKILIDALAVPVTAAIGNSGPSPETTESPANVPSALGVGAVNASDTIADFSARGPVTWNSISSNKPDISAPGVSIKSSSKAGASAYEERNGTSMSAPHAAGVIVLMLQVNSSLDAAYIRRVITQEAGQRSGLSYPNNDYGWGVLNALRAVRQVMRPDTNPPVITHTPLTSARYNSAITIQAVITDEVTTTPAANLYYRNLGTTWEAKTMEDNGQNVYAAVIPAGSAVENLDYYIQAADLMGNTATTAAFSVVLSAASGISISNVLNSPNPVGSSGTNLTFYLSKSVPVEIRIYDIAGNLIKTISVSGNLGYNSVFWDGLSGFGEPAGNGVYLYQLLAEDGGQKTVSRGKVIVLR